jgi:hypothetical protein
MDECVGLEKSRGLGSNRFQIGTDSCVGLVMYEENMIG